MFFLIGGRNNDHINRILDEFFGGLFTDVEVTYRIIRIIITKREVHSINILWSNFIIIMFFNTNL